jgi:hypothetical protein
MRSDARLLAVLLVTAASLGTAEEATDAPRPQKAEPEIAERILAVVDARPLLLSTVRALEVVRGLEVDEALEAAIDERLMFQEASRLPQAQVTDEETEQALESFRQGPAGIEARVPEAELKRLLKRQLTILKYVDFRFRPQVRISDDALRDAWNADFQGEPEGPAFEESAPALRERLAREELDRRIEGWVSDLRARAAVRYVDGPGSPPGPDPAGP